MQNLNKFTKHELINKIKKLDNQNSNQGHNQGHNQSFLHKIVSTILLFKSLILKLTLITLIIKWIKKYSLVKKFWHIFSLIASTLLGLSIVDIYSLDIISWIKDTSIYKWYSDLLYPKEIIKNNKSEFQFPKRITDKTTENETEHTRISEWINRNPKKEIEESKEDSIWDIIQNNSKAILIVSGVIIISGLSWYYFDEIKDIYTTSIEWIRNHFSKPSAGDTGGQTSATQGSSQSTITPTSPNIQLTDNQTPDTAQVINKEPDQSRVVKVIEREYGTDRKLSKITLRSEAITEEFSANVKGKGVLTSPSLEDLNNKVQESWENSSDSSSSTITLDNINKTEVAPEKVLATMWRLMLPLEARIKMNYIESAFKTDSEIDATRATSLMHKLVDVIIEYNAQIDLVNSNHSSDWSLEDINNHKISLYKLRKWISEYHQLIIPTDELIEIGDISNVLTKIVPS